MAAPNRSTTPEYTTTSARLFSATEAKKLFHRIVEIQASENFSVVRHTPALSHFACDFLEVATMAQRLYDLSLMEDMSTHMEKLPATTLKSVMGNRSNTTRADQVSPVEMLEETSSSPIKPTVHYRRSASAALPTVNTSSSTTLFKRARSAQRLSIGYPPNSSPGEMDAPATNVFERLYTPPSTKKLDMKSPSHSRTKAPFRLYV
ncbi:hypothetical protein STCU_10426 [Strigomonas culicis]|uniref:Uncharacterized protein n=1 Tax=Strigomonas culicis TaxID=28005 RepID=S9V4F7_9TRYP|nr:hypothetical protein STCU_10426 [Strigomonas culicis]|eukprot:EPY17760.1 hypothetical protein STCU_10426 [Strigomonas culicis]